MRYMLAILLNGVAQIEYDRNEPLDPKQTEYLNKMDTKMQLGLTVGEQHIAAPGTEQKTKFVASNLYHAIKGDNEAMASAMTTYLAVRFPELKQVEFKDLDGNVAIELIYDKPYMKQVGVQFNSIPAVKPTQKPN